MYGYGSQSYTAEYRYAVAPLLAVGGAVVYSPFFYDKPTAPGFEQPTRNHNLSFGPRLHIRTSRYAERESLILYTGFMATHYRFYTTTLYVENEFGDDSTMYVPDAAGISLGIPFGIGFESSPIIFNKVRVRFSIDFTMPVTGDNLGIASFFALGLGYNW